MALTIERRHHLWTNGIWICQSFYDAIFCRPTVNNLSKLIDVIFSKLTVRKTQPKTLSTAQLAIKVKFQKEKLFPTKRKGKKVHLHAIMKWTNSKWIIKWNKFSENAVCLFDICYFRIIQQITCYLRLK